MGLSKKVKRGPSSTARVVSLTVLNCTIVRCLPKWQSKRKHLGQPGFEPDTTASSPSFKKNFEVVFPTIVGGRPAMCCKVRTQCSLMLDQRYVCGIGTGVFLDIHSRTVHSAKAGNGGTNY